jgi:hypothetical protein
MLAGRAPNRWNLTANVQFLCDVKRIPSRKQPALMAVEFDHETCLKFVSPISCTCFFFKDVKIELNNCHQVGLNSLIVLL